MLVIIVLATGLVIGKLAYFFSQGRVLSLSESLLIGGAGSILGLTLFSIFGRSLPEENYFSPITFIAAIVGAVLLIVIAGLIKK